MTLPSITINHKTLLHICFRVIFFRCNFRYHHQKDPTGDKIRNYKHNCAMFINVMIFVCGYPYQIGCFILKSSIEPWPSFICFFLVSMFVKIPNFSNIPPKYTKNTQICNIIFWIENALPHFSNQRTSYLYGQAPLKRWNHKIINRWLIKSLI